MTIGDVLNTFNYVGVFSYVLPFLLIFSIVFAIVKKSRLLGDDKAIHTIIAASVGLLALQFDMVSVFFADIFPKLGVFLAIVLVVLILFTFTGADTKKLQGLGVASSVIVVIWAASDFAWFGGPSGNFFYWVGEYFWSVVILIAIAGALGWVVNSSGSGGSGG